MQIANSALLTEKEVSVWGYWNRNKVSGYSNNLFSNFSQSFWFVFYPPCIRAHLTITLLGNSFMCWGCENRFCPHQPLCHGGFILSREVLLQGQYNTVGGDGGQDHVLKWCKGRKVKEITYHNTGTKLIDKNKQVLTSKQKHPKIERNACGHDDSVNKDYQ